MLLIGLLCCLFVPVLAAESPEAMSKRITNLENANQVLQETLGNTKLEQNKKIADLQKALDAEIKARLDLDASVKKLSDALAAEVTARGTSDKLIAELQTELANQAANSKLKIAALQADLDKTKADQAAINETTKAAQARTASQQKKDRTITYLMGIILGGIAVSK
jgi:hypothetical protein